MSDPLVTPQPARAGLPRWAHLPAQPLLRHVLAVGGAGVILWFFTTTLSEYDNLQVATVAMFAMAIAGVSVLTGVSGQISIGHGAFMAVGAYTAGLLMEHSQLPLFVPLVAGAACSALIGALIGLPATRLRGPYLAGVTLAIALAVQDIPQKFSSLFHGDQGIVVNPPTPPRGVLPERWLAWITLVGALVTMILLANFLKSRFGRSLRAVRDDEIAASIGGLHAARLRVLAFAVSAAAAGLAGGYFALITGIVSPNTFNLFLSIQLLAGMVIGGSGTLAGAWWGAIAVVYIPQWTTSLSSHLNLSSGVQANLSNAFFGLLLVIITMLAPSGIQGWLRSAISHLGAAVSRLRPRHLSDPQPISDPQPLSERTNS